MENLHVNSQLGSMLVILLGSMSVGLVSPVGHRFDYHNLAAKYTVASGWIHLYHIRS